MLQAQLQTYAGLEEIESIASNCSRSMNSRGESETSHGPYIHCLSMSNRSTLGDSAQSSPGGHSMTGMFCACCASTPSMFQTLAGVCCACFGSTYVAFRACLLTVIFETWQRSDSLALLDYRVLCMLCLSRNQSNILEFREHEHCMPMFEQTQRLLDRQHPVAHSEGTA